MPPLENDPWVQQYSSLITAPKAHALGIVGFLWNGCERRIVDLYWLACGLTEDDEDGPLKAMRPSCIYAQIMRGFRSQNAGGQVIDEITFLIALCEANRKNRNQLSHYDLHASTVDVAQNSFTEIKLMGRKLRETYDFDESLIAIRNVAEDIVRLMDYFNGVLQWSVHHLHNRLPAPQLPPRPPMPRMLR
jgi:hypothetical protein